MKNITLSDHKKRIDNIESADRDNRSYCRRHRIRDYMPGQCTYNLGDYPARVSMEPTEYDYNMLKELAEKGVELIQLHEEWNDAIRHWGADKFTSPDPKGLHNFVDLCHYFGLKVIPYISTGYFQVNDPDFREDFTRGDYRLYLDYYRYRLCWAGSPSWRKFILPKTFEAVDEYGFDGIYNDWGYDGLRRVVEKLEASGHSCAHTSVFDLEYDPVLEDLLSTIYSEVHRRGGVYKIHCDRNNTTPCKDKVYDYLWIGEGATGEYGVGKTYEPYVIPCQHNAVSDMTNPDSYYAQIIPFMQFPLLKRGRPMTGAGIDEDVEFLADGFDYQIYCDVKKFYNEHPNGPYTYSLWSSIPDDVNEYPRWCKYLSLYKPMVVENSVAYIELRDSADILSPLPKDVYASMFVNDEKYLVVSNLTDEDYTLDLRDVWKDRVTENEGKTFTVKPKSIIFLIKV